MKGSIGVVLPSSFSYLHCVHLSHSINPSPLADDTSFSLLLSPALFFPFFPHTNPLLTLTTLPQTWWHLQPAWEPVSWNSYRWKWNESKSKRKGQRGASECMQIQCDTHTHTHLALTEVYKSLGVNTELNQTLHCSVFIPPSAAKEEPIPSKLLFSISITKSHFVPIHPKTHLHFRTNSSPSLLAITTHQMW